MGACSALCSLGLVAIACPLLLVVLLVLLMLLGLTGCAWLANSGAVVHEVHLVLECTAHAALQSRYASLFTSSTDSMMSFLAQPDHMGGSLRSKLSVYIVT